MAIGSVGEGDWKEWPYRHIVSIDAGPIIEPLPVVKRRDKRRQRKFGSEDATVGYYFEVANAGGGRLRAKIKDESIRTLSGDDAKLGRRDFEERRDGMSKLARHFRDCQKWLLEVLRAEGLAVFDTD